jgi:asparagine synthase (glutamine-hydrolysing)
LVEFAAKIPSYYKIPKKENNGYETKSILKSAMKGILPNQILQRPKQAFPFPIKEWFWSKLSDYCKDIILLDQVNSSNFFDPGEVEKLLNPHSIEPTQKIALQIRNLLFFEIWRQTALN